MHLFRYLSLATATLLFSVVFPLLPINSAVEPLVVQAQTTQDRKAEALRLNAEGHQLSNSRQFQEALAKFQQALVIVREISERQGERVILDNMGQVYDRLGQYPKALDIYQQALVISQEINDKAGKGITLNNIGEVYDNLGQYAKALDCYQQALAIYREIGDKSGTQITLSNIGVVYRHLGQYAKALDFYHQALVISQEIKDKVGEGSILNNIGTVYDRQGQYAKALDFYHQALAIRQKIDDKAGEQTTLSNIGVVYRHLGQYTKALDFYHQALAICHEIKDKVGEGSTLDNIGEVYNNQGQYAKALDFFSQALAIRHEIGDKSGEQTTLSNIGIAYRHLGQYTKALDFYHQALAICHEIDDKVGEGSTLNNIGDVYNNQGQYDKALDVFSQALAISQEVNDREGEGTTLSNIGYLLEKQNQPELAIAFYKQSVNVTQAIRQDIRVLPKELQQSYTKTVADTYRSLADLLLKKNRVLEAQQVLDLLKVQELQDYLHNVRGNEQTATGLPNLPSEQKLLDQYNAKLTQVVQLGKELEQLQKIPEGSRTIQQETRRRQLEADQRKIKAEFIDFLGTPEVVALVQQLSSTTSSENLNPKVLTQLQQGLKQLKQDAVLLYPLILEDRLELVLVTPYTPPIHRPVLVKREELNRAIADFRSALTDPLSTAKEPARKLYNWLIQPIEAALQEAKAKTIIYAPDSQLRYIPLAALYDGNQWLVQKYRVNNITNLSLTNFNQQPQALKVLAGALTQAATVEVGERTFKFDGLPSAGKEVENLADTVPGTTKLLGRDFSQQETLDRVSGYSVLHLATHATFVTDRPGDSFIVFGNNDRATFIDVQKWTLTNLDLVVLSACQTGLGGQLGNGTEILGFGYLMQQAGARAAIASLWSVNDGGTQALMNAFYGYLKKGHETKAEALQEAQIALITGDDKALGEQRGSLVIVQERIRHSLPAQVRSHLSHPYYWAPFILIGNGL